MPTFDLPNQAELARFQETAALFREDQRLAQLTTARTAFFSPRGVGHTTINFNNQTTVNGGTGSPAEVENAVARGTARGSGLPQIRQTLAFTRTTTASPAAG